MSDPEQGEQQVEEHVAPTTPRTPRTSQPARARWYDATLLRHLLMTLVGVVVVVALTALVTDYAAYQLAQLGAYVCAASGLTLLTGGNGQVSLGHAALMAIGAYTVALLQTRFADAGLTGQWQLPVSLLAAVLVTAVAGALFGAAAARLRGPYLAGATLALGVAIPGITSHFSGLFKGDQGLFVPFDAAPLSLGAGFTLQHWQAWISLGCALITLFFLANLNRSSIGRHMRAVRDDEIAASLSGLSVPRIQIGAFAISAAAAGLGGGVLAMTLQTASPGSFSLVLSLGLLSAVVIGGLGSLTGAVWGSIVVVYLGTFISDNLPSFGLSSTASGRIQDNLAAALYGLLLILVIRAAPGGIQGLLRALTTRFRRPTATDGGSS